MSKREYIVLANLSYLPEFGGVENSLRHLAEEYRKLGYTPIILCCESPQLKYTPIAKMGNAVVVRSPRQKGFAGSIKTVFGLIVYAFSLSRLRKVQVVICRNQISSFFVRLAFKSQHVYVAPGFARFQTADRNMTTSNASTLDRLKLALKREVNNWLDRRALVDSDRVFLFSENMLEQSRVVLGRNRHLTNRFNITKPGVSTERFCPPVDSDEKLHLRAKYKLPLDGFIYLCIGRLVAAKGFDTAIKAMSYLEDGCYLVVAGVGPEFEQLKSLVKKYSLEKRVFLVGAANVPEHFYRLSDAFLMTSRYEPLGQTILEAAATGLPIISYKSQAKINSDLRVTNATYEIIGDFGYYVESFDERLLASKMNEIISHKASQSLSQSLRELVESKFSWQALAHRLITRN